MLLSYYNIFNFFMNRLRNLITEIFETLPDILLNFFLSHGILWKSKNLIIRKFNSIMGYDMVAGLPPQATSSSCAHFPGKPF